MYSIICCINMNNYLYIHKQVYIGAQKIVMEVTLNTGMWNVEKDTLFHYLYFSTLFEFSKIDYDMF